MLLKSELLWTYSPKDFFEFNSPSVHTADGQWRFSDGVATLLLATPVEPLPPDVMIAARAALTNLMNARTLLVDRSFELAQNPTIHQHTENGINHTMMALTGSLLVSSLGQMDFVVGDSLGNVLRDTGKERRDTESQLMVERAQKMDASSVLAFLHERYHHALSHPASEFVHLFEIVDAVETYFGGKKAANQALGITAARDVLGAHANDKPVLEGRHNGRHHDRLRPATPDERQQARGAAKAIIKAFADSL